MTFSHLFLLRNGVLTPAQLLKKRLDFSPNLFFYRFWEVDENHTRQSLVSGSSANELRLVYFNVTFESEENKHNVMLNLFQHLTRVACLLHFGKTLK